eukprot:5723232-Prymnesium_polylepis.2
MVFEILLRSGVLVPPVCVGNHVLIINTRTPIPTKTVLGVSFSAEPRPRVLFHLPRVRSPAPPVEQQWR